MIKMQPKCGRCRTKAMMIAAKASGSCRCKHIVKPGSNYSFLENDKNISMCMCVLYDFSMCVGVSSVELQGENKNQMVVIGDGIDAAALTSSVRKKIKNASLELVQQL